MGICRFSKYLGWQQIRLRSHKLRSFLTLLGIIFGVATVILVVSVIEGFNAYVDEKIANIGTNAFSIQKFSIDDFSSVEALNVARREIRTSESRT